MTAFAKELRRNATPSEKIMWQRLRNRKLGGFKFYRQHVIANYIADFLCKDAMLVVEIDGEYHQDDAQLIRDQHRDAGLGLIGYRVLRITNSEVLINTDAVCSTILDAIYNSIEAMRAG